jgi:hypothetical protein
VETISKRLAFNEVHEHIWTSGFIVIAGTPAIYFWHGNTGSISDKASCDSETIHDAFEKIWVRAIKHATRSWDPRNPFIAVLEMKGNDDVERAERWNAGSWIGGAVNSIIETRGDGAKALTGDST